MDAWSWYGRKWLRFNARAVGRREHALVEDGGVLRGKASECPVQVTEGWQRRLVIPLRCLGERAHCAHRLIFALRDHGEKAAVADDLQDAGQIPHGGEVDAAQCRCRTGGPHVPSVHHAVEP
jgi:hypothetical protein